MTLNPKQRFCEDKPVSAKHHDLVVDNGFLKACDSAMLQLVHDTARGNVDAQTALAGYYRISGAVDYLRTLLNLTEKPTAETRFPDVNLNFSANKK